VTDVHEGDMVAAPFDSDNLWYRAQVWTVEDNKVDLYYGDFGDSEWVDKDRIRQLRLESNIMVVLSKYKYINMYLYTAIRL